MILRNPEVNVALFNHTSYDIMDYGFFHQGADIVILENPDYMEESLKEQLLENGILVRINDNEIIIKKNDTSIFNKHFEEGESKNAQLIAAIKPYLEELINNYE